MSLNPSRKVTLLLGLFAIFIILMWYFAYIETNNNTSPSPTPSSTPTPSLTSTPPATPTPINAPAYLENYFNQYAIHYNVSANLLKKIAWCESRFDPLVVNGPYVGLYQFMESIWITYRTQMGHDINPELRKNAEESIKTAAYIISLGKLHLWPNCVE